MRKQLSGPTGMSARRRFQPVELVKKVCVSAFTFCPIDLSSILFLGKCFCLYSEERQLPAETSPQITESNITSTVLFLKRMEIAGLRHCDFIDRPGEVHCVTTKTGFLIASCFILGSSKGINRHLSGPLKHNWRGVCGGFSFLARGSTNESALSSCLGLVSHELTELTRPRYYPLLVAGSRQTDMNTTVRAKSGQLINDYTTCLISVAPDEYNEGDVLANVL